MAWRGRDPLGPRAAAREDPSASTSWPLRSTSGEVVDGERVIAIVAKDSSRVGAGGPLLRRLCDSPAQAGTRTKAVVPSLGRTRLDLGDSSSQRNPGKCLPRM